MTTAARMARAVLLFIVVAAILTIADIDLHLWAQIALGSLCGMTVWEDA